jgi:glycosyltransferase involved in cell wall biosynthesis
LLSQQLCGGGYAVNITVILCTHNRCQSLAKTLSSVAASTLPEAVEWEVLVVDNNSTDQTREVVEDFCHRFPRRFRYLFEPQPGKSYALNAGIHEARGEVLAFLDDDVTVERTWLQNLTSGLRDGVWAGTGGRIVLQWPTLIPPWLAIEGKYSRHPFPGFDQGDIAKELSSPLFGTNMAFRKKMFEKYGGFRTDLGPSTNCEILRPSEDTEFGRRLLAGGERLWYEPSAIVYHPVSEKRIQKKYFLDWWFDYGRADARLFEIPRLHLLGSLLAWMLRWMRAREPRQRFHHKLVVWEKVGRVIELYRQWREGKPKREPYATP